MSVALTGPFGGTLQAAKDLLAGSSVYQEWLGVKGTARPGGSETIRLSVDASREDDAYNTLSIVTTGGTGSGQTRTIDDYDGSTQTVTVDSAWSTEPDGTTTYEIRSGGSLADAAKRHTHLWMDVDQNWIMPASLIWFQDGARLITTSSSGGVPDWSPWPDGVINLMFEKEPDSDTFPGVAREDGDDTVDSLLTFWNDVESVIADIRDLSGQSGNLVLDSIDQQSTGPVEARNQDGYGEQKFYQWLWRVHLPDTGGG